MSTVQRFIRKVEQAISDFVENGPEGDDRALVRLYDKEERLLEELKSLNIQRAGRSFFTCASVSGLLLFSLVGYAFSWPFPVLLILGMCGITAALNGYAVLSGRTRVQELKQRHTRLLESIEQRRMKRKQLLDNSSAEDLVLTLDGLDERLTGNGDGAERTRRIIRERARRLRREYLIPMLNFRERRARYLLDKDPEGLAEEIQQAMQRQAEHEAELDIESGMILERTLNAKRETLQNLYEADREFDTVELMIESIRSQIEQVEALIAKGEPYDPEEFERVFDEMEHGLALAPGVPQPELPQGNRRRLTDGSDL